MSEEVLKKKILDLIEEPLRLENCVVADMALSRYKRDTTLRFFVYCDIGPDLEKCAHISRVIGDMIDGTDWFERGYTLEVSSPGLDRPLKSLVDFKYRIGETIRVEFEDTGKKKLTAEIIGVKDNEVELKDEEKTLVVPLSEIKQAKIVF
ncbi:MAG: hypothetical protein ABIJ12_03970 [bacterium]